MLEWKGGLGVRVDVWLEEELVWRGGGNEKRGMTYGLTLSLCELWLVISETDM